ALLSGGGMIGVGGVLGQTTEGARDLVQNGVQTIEDQLRDLVVAQIIPESTGNLLDLLKNGREVMDALSAARPPATFTLTISTNGTGHGTVTANPALSAYAPGT